MSNQFIKIAESLELSVSETPELDSYDFLVPWDIDFATLTTPISTILKITISEFYRCIGDIYSANKKHKKAISSFEKATKVYENHKAYFELGTTYHYRLVNLSKALEAYEKAYSLNPNADYKKSIKKVKKAISE